LIGITESSGVIESGNGDRSVIFSFQPGPSGESAVYTPISFAVSAFPSRDTDEDESLSVTIETSKAPAVGADHFGIGGRFLSH